MSTPPAPLAQDPAAARRRHELRTSVTILRLRTQLLHRLASRQDGPDWSRLADGLTALDADLSTLLRQLDLHDDR